MNGISRVESGRYSCPACERRFHGLGEKKAHIRTEHTKPTKEKP